MDFIFDLFFFLTHTLTHSQFKTILYLLFTQKQKTNGKDLNWNARKRIKRKENVFY